MYTINNVSVSYGRTISDGNFNNMKLNVSFSAEVASDADPLIVAAELHTLARAELTRQAEYNGRVDGLIRLVQQMQYSSEKLRGLRLEVEVEPLLDRDRHDLLGMVDDFISANEIREVQRREAIENDKAVLKAAITEARKMVAEGKTSYEDREDFTALDELQTNIKYDLDDASIEDIAKMKTEDVDKLSA